MKTLLSIGCLALFLSSVQGQNVRPLIDPVCGLPGVRILPADAGPGDYRILASDGLESSDGWETLAEMTVGTGGTDWLDLGAHRHGRRFFRVMQLPINPPLIVADNFRLIDQTGRSFELHRAGGDTRVFVLVFADTASLSGAWSELKALRANYESKGVVFWVINSKDDYASITAQASALAVDIPILHDRAQTVARAYHCVSQLEAVAIRGDDLTPFYRGALSEICDTVSPVVVRRYLADALDSTLAEKPIAMSYARGGDGSLEYRAVAGLDYAKDIAPIFLNRCVRCHRKGDIGSFEMSEHAVLVNKAQNIRRDLLTGDMPPWHADPNVSRFSNDFSLTPEESSKLLAWLDAGLPRGTGPDPLVEKRPAPAVDWPLGEPDYKISLDEFVVPPTGTVDYQYIAIKNPLPTNAWLRATVLKPGDRTVVHHALAFAGSTSELVALSGGLGGYFAAYVPGMDQTEYPESTGKLLKAGAWLLFQMHYTTSGVEARDRTEIGLYFAKGPPQRELKTTAAYDTRFIIPAGAVDHEVVGITKPFSKAAYIYELSPHMHYRGSRMRFEAVLPNGTIEVLANVPAYQFDWQTLYRFEQPKLLPAGSRIRVVGGFDNSSRNPRLAASGEFSYELPVEFGEQSWEEMLIGYINYADAP